VGRKRIDLGPAADSQIVARMARGDSAAQLAHDFGVSRPTMQRRMRELRGRVPAARAENTAAHRAKISPPSAAAPPSPPSTPAEPDGDALYVPEDSTLQEIDKWLAVAKERAEHAAASDNAEEHATYMRMIIALIEARRKAAPVPKTDPNDQPDMIEAAKRVRKRWHDLADNLVRVSKSPLAATIGRMLREKSV
jgi:hypothetical protein